MDRAARATPKVHENEALILKRHGGAIQERGARRTAFPTIARGFANVQARNGSVQNGTGTRASPFLACGLARGE